MISEDLIKRAVDLFKQYPNNIGASLLQRKLKIGIIKANQILETLENENIISEYDEKVGRKLKCI